MTTALLLAMLSALCTGLVSGIFFAFSVFVMRALSDLPPAQGIVAMQRINVTVLNPLFLCTFFGAAPLLAVATYAAHNDTAPTATAWLAASCVTYLLGTVGVTVAFNVPRNKRLAVMTPDSPQAIDYWPIYVKEWLRWNHVRCVASLLATAGCIIAAAN